jgi:hypothetical protein
MCVSGACFLQVLFGKDCFKKKNMSGLTVYTLRPETFEARQLLEWLDRGVADAINKKFLDEVSEFIVLHHLLAPLRARLCF